jgi:hypothetical protein
LPRQGATYGATRVTLSRAPLSPLDRRRRILPRAPGKMRAPALQNALVEAYRLTYKLYGHASLEKARTICRSLGLTFSNEEASKLLAPFIAKAHAASPPRNGRHFGRNDGRQTTPKAEGSTNGTTDSRVANEPLLVACRRSASPHVTADKRGGATASTRPLKLPLDLAEKRGRHAILEPIWAELQPHVHHMTKTRWKTMNGRFADDMHSAGATPEQVLDAWRELSKDRGEFILSLSVVQRAMAQRGARITQQRRFDSDDEIAALR